MKKKLIPIGNSLGIIIDRPFVDLLGINKKTQVIMVCDGKHLIIKPIKSNAMPAKPKPKASVKKKSNTVKAAAPKKKKPVPKTRAASVKKKRVITRRK